MSLTNLTLGGMCANMVDHMKSKRLRFDRFDAKGVFGWKICEEKGRENLLFFFKLRLL